MVIIITESQLPRAVALHWLIKYTKDFKKVTTEKSIKIVSNDNEVIFDYDKVTNTLYVDYSRIWSMIYHHLRFDKDESRQIIRAFAIDFLGLKELKIKGKFDVKNLNDFSKDFSFDED